MLTWEDDVEVHALRRRGWTISAIARHTRFDRKTVRKYLNGEQKPGMRVRLGPDRFDPFVDYVAARLTEDPHLWARTLLDELEELGFGLSYQSLTRNIRTRNLRPVCQACRTATQRPNVVIAHSPGDETQWDWLELPNPHESWGWGKTAHPLVGSLAYSGKWRAAWSSVAGSTTPGGCAGQSDPRTRRGDSSLAVRPDGHRLRPRQRPSHGVVCRGGQALRGGRGDLPGTSWRRSTTPPPNAGGCAVPPDAPRAAPRCAPRSPGTPPAGSQTPATTGIGPGQDAASGAGGDYRKPRKAHRPGSAAAGPWGAG